MSRNSIVEIAGLVLCAGIFIAVESSGQMPPSRGEWSLSNWTRGEDIQLKLSRHTVTSHWSWSSPHPLEELHGLTRDQLHSTREKVRFTLDKDAGTFVFEGSLILGVGQGVYDFVPNSSFTSQLRSLGYDTSDKDDLFWMAVQDVSLPFARAVRESGLRDLRISDLRDFRSHGIDVNYLRDITSFGYTDFSAHDLINLKNHGVDAHFLRGLKKAGYNLSADEIVRLRNQGVDAQYMAGLKAAGYEKSSVDEIVKLRNNGVDPEYVHKLNDSGARLDTGDIVKLRNHGVNSEFVKQVRQSGFNSVSVDDLVRLQSNGVDGGYISRLQSSGFKGLTIDQIIRLHNHGVD